MLATALWAPAMQAVARGIRPAQLNHVSAYPFAVLQAVAADASRRMWTILIVSFLALIALAAAAIVLNRRALRTTRDELADRLRRLTRWAAAGLLLGLALTLAAAIISPALSSVAAAVYSPSLASLVGQSFGVLIIAGAMAGLILGATIVRRAATPATSAEDQRMARTALVVMPVILLGGFFATAILAQFTVAFYLKIVF